MPPRAAEYSAGPERRSTGQIIMNVKHPDRLYRADRLNHIVNRMRVRQDITPARLAGELHVSERTIYRDLKSLEKGEALKKRYSRREGRYLLEAELALPPIKLTSSEAVALHMAAANPGLSLQNFLSDDLGSAVCKLDDALTPARTKDGEGADTRPPDGPVTDSSMRSTIETLRRAMRSNRKVRIRYWAGADDHVRMLTVAPYDLRHTQNGWIMVGMSPEIGAAKAFRLRRVRAVEILPDRFRFPRKFSADDCFERAWLADDGVDKEVTIKLRFVPSMAETVARNCGHQFETAAIQPDGSLLCSTQVNSTREVGWWILSYGAAVEVVEPQELRQELGRVGSALVAMYASHG